MQEPPAAPDVSDEQLVAATRQHVAGAFEKLLRRYNQRLFRIARAHVRDDVEAEDVVQQAWVQVYGALEQWTGRGSFSGWVSSIVINACRQRRRHVEDELPTEDFEAVAAQGAGPEDDAQRVQVRAVLERHVDALPETLRAVFVLRDVEELSGAEVAALLQITEPLVRVRLHRARAALEASIQAEFEGEGRGLYPFMGSRCDRLTAAVLRTVKGG